MISFCDLNSFAFDHPVSEVGKLHDFVICQEPALSRVRIIHRVSRPYRSALADELAVPSEMRRDDDGRSIGIDILIEAP